jgi:hypothetical protein
LSGSKESDDKFTNIGAPVDFDQRLRFYMITGPIMPDDIEDRIRERAYHLWRESGCMDGETNRHWLAAEREVLAAFAASAPAKPPQSAAKKATPKTKARAAGGARRSAS